MKHSAATSTEWSDWAHFGEIRGTVADFATKMGAGLLKIIKLTQVARMRSVLEAMSDSDLNHIGVKRENIAQYAERLILDEV